MSILDEIVAKRRERLQEEKAAVPLADLQAQLADLDDRIRNFRAALRGPFVRVIAEIKRASPSAGTLRDIFDPRSLAQDYAGGGAAAISVLTEEDYFQGALLYLRRARSYMALPVMRKDFLIDPYQIFQARLWRADAVLLIAAILEVNQLQDLLDLTHDLGMEALVETHDGDDMYKALSVGARVIGINNRDLKTMQIDLARTEQLAKLAPPETVLVSESGLQGREDIERLAQAGVDAVLIGTMLMKHDQPGSILRRLINVPATPERRV